MNEDSTLQQIYYNPGHPAAFSNADRLFLAVDKRIPKKSIQHWLKKQLTYTLHRPKRKHFDRLHYLVDNIDDQWQTDLIDLRSISYENKGYNFIVVIIDVFSKFAWTVPIKQKIPSEIIKAFRDTFNSSRRKPLNVMSDKGKEYTNLEFRNFLKSHDINYFTSKNEDTKACIAERFIRSIKEIIFKYLTSKNTLKYIDVLDKLTDTYNNRYHRSIGMTPAQVNETNILEVWHNIKHSQYKRSRDKKPKYTVGKYVRISKTTNIFDKGYFPNYSDEIFKIKKVIRGNPNVYRLVDLLDEEIDGRFYEEELQDVIYSSETVFRVKKIVTTRYRNGVKEALVEWRGYSPKFNSWIPYKNIQI
jgi:hypothetical protein